MANTCELCGREFTARSKTVRFCSNPHSITCFHCGTALTVVPRQGKKRYSCKAKACMAEARRLTSLERYGVENPAQATATREKLSQVKQARTPEEVAATVAKAKATNRERYGVESALQNPEVKARQEATLREHYGVTNPMQAPEVKERVRATVQERYGEEHFFITQEFKKKLAETSRERYGVEHPLQSEEVRAKGRRTSLERYGVENPAQAPAVKARIKKTFETHYGTEDYLNSPEGRAKSQATLQERYGVTNAAQAPEVQARMRATTQERYGAENIMQVEEFRRAREEEFLDKHGVKNPTELHVSNYSDFERFEEYLAERPQTIPQLAAYFAVTEGSIRRKVREGRWDDLVLGRYATSMKEAEFFSRFKDAPTELLRNDRKLLGGKEVDFYFPEHRLAVEISPTSTHNSKRGFAGGMPKPPSYHQEKALGCLAQGVELLTVFDWHPWERMVEMVEHRLQGSQRIAARKCRSVFVTPVSPELRTTVASWHVLGLEGALRKPLGASLLFASLAPSEEESLVGVALWTATKDPAEAELKRLVFRPGYAVTGGASKLLKCFLQAHPEVKRVLTFSDMDLGGGSVYERLGFKLLETSRPQLQWHHPKQDLHVKQLSLVKQGADRLLRNFPDYVPVGVGDGLPTNSEILESYGFLPVWDCGYRRWRLTV